MESKVEKRKSKMVKLLVWFLFLAANCGLSAVDCFPATKVFLHAAASKIVPNSSFLYCLADGTQGTTVATTRTDSITGPLTGHYWPIVNTGYIVTQSATVVKRIWFSAPLSSGVTISGTITPNLWGYEYAATTNAAARYEVLRWSVARGGIVSSLGISAETMTEWGTTSAVRTAPALVPTSTAFVTGDRIVIVIYNDDGNGVTEVSGDYMYIRYDGATGVDGDTYLSFTETISFSADSNNAPARAGGTN
jgi:hypothetical protein